MARNILWRLIVLAVLCWTGLAQAQETIRVSVPSTEITSFCMGIRIARHPQFPGPAQKYRLKYEDVAMPIPQVPVNVSNNQIEIGECSGISTVLNAWNKGAKNMVVFAFGAQLPVFQMVGPKSIRNFNDLKGKAIGVPGVQSAGAEAIEMIMKRGAKMLPGRDFDFVTVGAGPATVAALMAGKVHAISSFPPLSYQLEQSGFPVIADLVTYVPQYVSGTHLVSKSWAEKNRGLMVRVMKSIIETGDWLRDPTKEKEVVAFFADYLPSGSKEKLGLVHAQRAYDFYVKQKRLSFDGYAPESAVRANIEILKERGYLQDSEVPPLGQVFDFSYLNQALKELGRPLVREYPAN